MIALDLYGGENSLANHLSSPKGVGVHEACADESPAGHRCQRPGESDRTAPRL
jgi:hypothetical protein